MQGVLVFASEAARDAAITSPQEGQFAFTKDNNSLGITTGAAWVASGATGDIEGGDVINIAQIGAGQVTLAEGAGVTITSTGATARDAPVTTRTIQRG
jgi:hypothetical protein